MSIPPNVSPGDGILIPLDRIPTGTESQARTKINDTVVREYAAAMKRQLAEGGLRFPPIVLFTDGQDYWLGDGFHRVLAARQAGLAEIAAGVHSGTQRDALLHSISANSDHGLARSSADKRKAVALLLNDSEWSQWSDREIARRCGVSNHMVRRMRRSASGTTSQIGGRKVQRGSTVYEMMVNSGGSGEGETAEETHPLPAGPEKEPLSSNGPLPKPPSPIPNDLLGLPVPELRADVFAALPAFQEAKELFVLLSALLDRIAQKPGGELYRQDLIRTNDNGLQRFACPALRASLGRLLAAEPYCAYCPYCQPAHAGWARPDCKTCGGRGWTTRHAFESCPASYQQQILRLLG
jgi:hypothetical protein